MLHITTLGYSDTSVIYSKYFVVKFVLIPHVLYSNDICEILLYKPQLAVITCERIYVVRTAHEPLKLA